MSFKQFFAGYKKFIVALTAFLTILGVGLEDGNLSTQEIIVSVVAGLSAIGVERVRNEDV